MVSNNDWCLLKSVSGGSVLLAKVCNIRYISNGVVGVSQFYDLSRIVIALSTEKSPNSPLMVNGSSYVSFAYLSKTISLSIKNIDVIAKYIESLTAGVDLSQKEFNKKHSSHLTINLENEKIGILKSIQPIEYM